MATRTLSLRICFLLLAFTSPRIVTADLTGCYPDEVISALSPADVINYRAMTSTQCGEYCRGRHPQNQYGAVRNTECLCFQAATLACPVAPVCDRPCPGNTDDFCGGANDYNVIDLAARATTYQSCDHLYRAHVTLAGDYYIRDTTLVTCVFDDSPQYIGCMTNIPDPVASPFPIGQIGICRYGCNRFRYSLASDDWCYCLDTLDGMTTKSLAECDIACGSEATESCGGYYSSYSVFYTFGGCYTLLVPDLLSVSLALQKNSTLMTGNKCHQFCKGNQFRYAILNGEVCACSNDSFNNSMAVMSGSGACRTVCPGSASEHCAGGGKILVENTDLSVMKYTTCDDLYLDGIEWYGPYELAGRIVNCNFDDMAHYMYCREPNVNETTTYYTIDTISVSVCRLHCGNNGMPYSALLNGTQCLCSIDDSAYVTPSSGLCHVRCPGNQATYCGGKSDASVYLSYGGCYESESLSKDLSVEDFAFDHANMSADFCIEVCRGMGYVYAYTIRDHCACQSRPEAGLGWLLSEFGTECDTVCPGGSEYCGGGNYKLVHNLETNVAKFTSCEELKAVGIDRTGFYRLNSSPQDATYCQFDGCPALSNVTNAVPDSSWAAKGSVVTVACPPDTEMAGELTNLTTVCGEDWRWHPTPILCSEIYRCPSDLTVTNAAVITSGQTLGSLAVITCDPGTYFPWEETVAYAQCVLNSSVAEWDPVPGDCQEPGHCVSLDTLTTAVPNTSDTSPGTTVNLTCLPETAFLDRTVSMTTTCVGIHSPVWDNKVMNCSDEIHCDSLSTLSNANVTSEDRYVGSVVTLQCPFLKAFPSRQSSLDVLCSEDLLWRPVIQNCEAVPACPHLENLTNAGVAVLSQTYVVPGGLLYADSEVNLTCPGNTTMSRTYHRSLRTVCTWEGTWSPPPDVCKEDTKNLEKFLWAHRVATR